MAHPGSNVRNKSSVDPSQIIPASTETATASTEETEEKVSQQFARHIETRVREPFKFGHVPRCATQGPLSPRSPTEQKAHQKFHGKAQIGSASSTTKKPGGKTSQRAATPGPGSRKTEAKVHRQLKQVDSTPSQKTRDRSTSLRSRQIMRANSLTQPFTSSGATHSRSNSAERPSEDTTNKVRDLSPRKTHHQIATEGTEGVPHLVLKASTVERLRDFGQDSVGRALGNMILQEGERIAEEAIRAGRQIAEEALSEMERAVERSAILLILRDAEQQQYFLRRWPLFENFLEPEGQASTLTREQVLQKARLSSPRDIKIFYTAALQTYEVDVEKIPFTTSPDVCLWEALVSAAQVFQFLKERLYDDLKDLLGSGNPTDFLLKLCEDKGALAKIESLDLSRHPESPWRAAWFPLWFWALELPNLDILNLKGHNCGLPENCLPKSKITFLDISDNPGFFDFPLDFWRLRKDLETLFFAQTSVERLPEGINTLRNLITIDGSFTGIRKFPKEFGISWENIVDIRFMGLQLEEDFPFENFRSKKNLSIIDLRGSRVKGKPITRPADWPDNITLIFD